MKLLKTAGGALMGYGRDGVKAVNSLLTGVFEVELITKSAKPPRRSALQNSYYWGVVLRELVAEHGQQHGLRDEDYHYIMKCAYFGVKEVCGYILPRGSTKKLNTTAMEDYLEMCRRVASERFDVYVPLPNEVSMGWGKH